MTDALRKDKRWQSVISNSRAIRGALGACLRLSDQLSDRELKIETMGFVNAQEYLAALLLREQTRVGPHRSPEKELVNQLRAEVAHIGQLLDENERIAHELGDSEAKKLVFASVNRLNQFAGMIDRKHS